MSQLLNKAKNYVAENAPNIKKPEANVMDMDLKDVSRECITYNAKVSVNNPYGQSLPICEISYTLKCAGRVIASGKIPDPGSVKANDTTMMDVGLKVPHSVLVTLAKDVGTDWDIDYELELGLTIDLPVIGKLTLPLSKKGEMKLPTLSDVF